MAIQRRNREALDRLGSGVAFAEASYCNYVEGLIAVAETPTSVDVSAVDYQTMVEHVAGLEKLFFEPPQEYLQVRAYNEVKKMPFGFTTKKEMDTWETSRTSPTEVKAEEDTFSSTGDSTVIGDVLRHNLQALAKFGPGIQFARAVYENYRYYMRLIAEQDSVCSPQDAAFIRQGVSRAEAHFVKPYVAATEQLPEYASPVAAGTPLGFKK